MRGERAAGQHHAAALLNRAVRVVVDGDRGAGRQNRRRQQRFAGLARLQALRHTHAEHITAVAGATAAAGALCPAHRRRQVGDRRGGAPGAVTFTLIASQAVERRAQTGRVRVVDHVDQKHLAGVTAQILSAVNVGAYPVQGKAPGLLKARQGVFAARRVLVGQKNAHHSEHQKGAEGEGEHQLDQRQTALARAARRPGQVRTKARIHAVCASHHTALRARSPCAARRWSAGCSWLRCCRNGARSR